MTPEQIEKLRAQADAYAAQELPFVHPLSMRFAQIRDTEFARLVWNAAIERVKEACEHGSDVSPYCIGCKIIERIESMKETT